MFWAQAIWFAAYPGLGSAFSGASGLPPDFVLVRGIL
jgi:hypothetical protein